MRQVASNVYDLENVTLTNIGEGSASCFPKPTALKAERIDKVGVRLSWEGNKSMEAVYMIYRSKDGIKFTYHALSVEPTYLDSRIENVRFYVYRIRVSSLDGTSPYSQTVQVDFTKK